MAAALQTNAKCCYCSGLIPTAECGNPHAVIPCSKCRTLESERERDKLPLNREQRLLIADIISTFLHRENTPDWKLKIAKLVLNYDKDKEQMELAKMKNELATLKKRHMGD